MTLALTTHEEGCTPFQRCRACEAADIIKSSVKGDPLKIFDGSSGTPFEPGSHLSGCTPLNPCSNCQAIALLTRTLRDPQFKKLMELITSDMPLAMFRLEQDPEYRSYREELLTPVSELGFSIRTSTAFKNSNVETLAQICEMTESDFLRIPNVGRTSLNEVKEVLHGRNLRFGMEFPSSLASRS